MHENSTTHYLWADPNSRTYMAVYWQRDISAGHNRAKWHDSLCDNQPWFVCALVSSKVWNCVDAGGRASIEVWSAAEIKVRYLDNRERAQGAGCGLLKKAQ
jgi:hypothetical protein